MHEPNNKKMKQLLSRPKIQQSHISREKKWLPLIHWTFSKTISSFYLYQNILILFWGEYLIGIIPSWDGTYSSKLCYTF